MKIKRSILLSLFFSVLGFFSYSQQNSTAFTMMFYNVENLFDIKNDSLTNDDEFTPTGDRHWTYKRMNQKLLNISKVILGAAGWNPPDIIALCEIENRYMLEMLAQKTPLKSIPYEIIHKESADHRGMETAMLYNPQQFYPLKYEFYPLKNKNDSILLTREILYVSGIVNNSDTLHIFVNHWPSRYTGLLETRDERNMAAQLLREKTEDLIELYISPKIIIVGDLNDQPQDESVLMVLGAKKPQENIDANYLYNLCFEWLNEGLGTLKYQMHWNVFDQIIVSGALLDNKTVNDLSVENASIVNLPFLFEKDEKYGGLKPFRSYVGFSYNGGFSDHLPVLLKLKSGVN